jgi:hypothetical protein
MSETTDRYDDMEYADLRSEAAERGLGGTGSKEELVAKLREADATDATRPAAGEYDALAADDLTAELEKRGLVVGGSEQEQRSRLEADDRNREVDEQSREILAERDLDPAAATIAAAEEAGVEAEGARAYDAPREEGGNVRPADARYIDENAEEKADGER